MTKTDKLKGKMREAGMTIEKLASAVGLSRTGLFNKIHGKKEFLVSEVVKICKILNIDETEMQVIFFAQLVD